MAVGQPGVVQAFADVGRPIPPELAATGFQLAVGTALGGAALIGARQLSTVTGDVALGALVLPVAIASAGVLLGAILLPSGA